MVGVCALKEVCVEGFAGVASGRIKQEAMEEMPLTAIQVSVAANTNQQDTRLQKHIDDKVDRLAKEQADMCNALHTI